MRRAIALPAVLALVAACSSVPAEEPATTTSAPSTTTSTIPPEPSLLIEGAPAGLTDLILAFYAFATGARPEPPPGPAELLPERGRGGALPPAGQARTGTFGGAELAVVEVGDDLFAAVDDGRGWRLVGGRAPSVGVDTHWGAFPRLVAVIGSDARPGEDVERSRADSLHLVGLDGAGGAGVVGIPRDAYVPVPGRGLQRINAALALAGPATMLQTLEETSGLSLEGYVLTGFVGFQEMLGNVLGGIQLEIPTRILDGASGADLEPGEQYLNGPDALAFARARKSLPGGDFTRQRHGGLLILGSLFAVQLRGPLAVPGLLEGSEAWLFTDLSPEQLLTFSMAALDTEPWRTPNVVVPGRAGDVDGASVILLAPGAQTVFEDLADGRLDGEY